MIMRLVLAAVLMTLPAAAAVAEAPATPAPPEDFPRFHFDGHDEQAEVLSDYLWYHFHHRLGNGLTLFNKEYLLLSDMWMNGAVPRGTETTIQELRRGHLLAIDLSPEGYVNTHQHFSHAHDAGWPFPMWTQAGFGPEEVAGVAAGWHFQPCDAVPGWVGGYLRNWPDNPYCGERAVDGWAREHLESEGIVDNAWRLRATGDSPTLLTPEGFSIDAFNAPYVQLRWSRSGAPPEHRLPYIEWLCDGDESFGPDRRVYLSFDDTQLSPEGRHHSIAVMHRHPKWRGAIERMRISLAPGESDVTFDIDSFFTVYDTRHTINNPIFILASWYYYTWTGDLAFLRENINRMRIALRYQQTVMGGLEHKLVRNPWPGHDGLAGFVRDEAGNKTMRPGHGIGSNYWDLMPFGDRDFYATYQYYAATRKMADLEEAILAHPGWDVPRGALALDPLKLREHAEAVKTKANEVFWNEGAGRFYASIDVEGTAYDYGYTFLNLDAIWYGIPSEEHALRVMDWISGKRIVEGDTSTGEDIYHWRFGPRATTLRNLDWYGQGWHGPESIPWGGQVQDGGAVLGFTFYDLWARLQVYGPDDAWRRLSEILAWESEVQAEGGYRAYYADGKRGTTLQGGGTAGGLGIDAEFFESSLLPCIAVYGFLGLDPRPDALAIAPRLPKDCPGMAVTNVLYRGVPVNVRAGENAIELTLKEKPVYEIAVSLPPDWRLEGQPGASGRFLLEDAGAYRWTRN